MKINIYIFFCIFFTSANSFAYYSDSLIFRENRLLARTINFGYVIEAYASPGSKDSIFRQLEMVKQVGFTAVRLPLNWITAMDSSDSWKINSSFMAFTDQIIKKALGLHMAVVLDNHSDEQLMDNPSRYGSRIFSLWEQLSVHFKNHSDSVMFELLAEPHGNLNAYWNMVITEVLKIVRVDNPQRPVIIGPINFNRPDFLYQLQLPANDRNIIISFHQYSPVKFTMQGETWFPFGKPLEWLGTTWPKKGDEESILKMFDRVNIWATTNHRPVFLGEFGVSSMADTVSASAWIRFNSKEAEIRGFSWGFWSCFGIEFSLYNSETKCWNTSFIEALMTNRNP
jgi:endoglucanase